MLKNDDIANAYTARPSIVDHLPWRDYNEKYKVFLLEDNKSMGVCFKITSIACDARPQVMLQEISKSISEAIKNSIPCEKDNPWTLQFYIQKSADLSETFKKISDYFPAKRKETELTQDFLQNLEEHFDFVSREGGIFQDTQVTNLPFKSGIVVTYAVLYRRLRVTQKNAHLRRSSIEEIIHVARKFSNQLRSTGMQIKRLNGAEFSLWMRKWFNPKMNFNTDYPTENAKPVGFDLAEQLFYSTPESYAEGWLFDGYPHKVLTIENMTTTPEIGHVSAERKRNVDDRVFNLLDHLPEESIFAITVVMQAPSEIEFHLKTIFESAVGRHALAEKIKKEVLIAEKSIADGNFLFPVVMNLYLKAENYHDLQEKQSHAEVLLNANGFKVITDHELFPIDAYWRYLPMAYDFYFDKNNLHRSRYFLLTDIAKLLPVYGRSRGTDHPGMIMFNRGGEPWFYDLYADRTKNAHFILMGETGTGKSNLLCYMIMHEIALYNTRFFVCEAGGSFDILAAYCRAKGLSVNHIKIDPKNPVSLNPFAHGLRVIEQIETIQSSLRNQHLKEQCDKLLDEIDLIEDQPGIDNNPDANEPRDILGDMVLAALIMITGGEKKEENTIRRSDRMLIIDAIIDAAYFVRDQKRDQMIASDIIAAFERNALKLDPVREAQKIRRIREMSDSMSYFTKDPVSSRFFNTYGLPWPLVDVTIIDFGLFAGEGYEAHRSIAFAGCASNIISIAEANQTGDRAIRMIIDESHLFLCIPLLAAIQTRISKMGRKLALWLGIATQNMKDFSKGAKRLLAQCEAWICLALPKDEIDQIEEFKELTLEQKALFLSSRKESGKYTEGVLMTPRINTLFRNVPPRLYLAMAATEQSEKFERAKMMAQHGCSEIEAVAMIARRMMQIRNEVHQDD
jgi:conjugative transfer ATPase